MAKRERHVDRLPHAPKGGLMFSAVRMQHPLQAYQQHKKLNPN
jgi:hypothetical protein